MVLNIPSSDLMMEGWPLELQLKVIGADTPEELL